jgi:hypothetical protein|tara:strand:+ start:2963 stop:7255 length:4293 start_codon:yes stop_codon:yes gene_type:complete
MAVGRISGPLLKSNLIRNGIDLAFETDLLYLDVTAQRIGIKTTTPVHELDVNGTTKTTNLIVDDKAVIDEITIENNTISTTNQYLNLGTLDNVVYQNKARIDSIDIEGNVISTNDSNANLEFRPNGTGAVEVYSDMNVQGNIHATGNITADGSITLGDADTDNVVFNAEVASNIIPNLNNTYNLGSDPDAGGKQWANIWANVITTSTLSVQELEVDGIDIALRPGNILFVAENGDDTHTGTHQQDPFASVKHALSVAAPGDTVSIFPGVYTEIFPLTVPVGVTLKGTSLRSVTIQPTTATRYKDAFLLNGESTIEDLMVTGFYSGRNNFTIASGGGATGTFTANVGTAPQAHAYASGGTITNNDNTIAVSVTSAAYNNATGVLTVNYTGTVPANGEEVFLEGLIFSCNGGNRTFPDNGYAFRFATDYTVTSRSPYIRNITVITAGTAVSALDPRGFDAGDAGKGAYIDGAYATSSSREAAMLFHSATFITPGVDTITATNGVRVEWLNSFTYFANRSFYCYDSNDGKYSNGKTRIRLGGLLGTAPAAGQTVTFTSTDSSTVVGPLNIESVLNGDTLVIDGKNAALVGFDTTPESITFSGTGTATTILNNDLRDFGAEVRMIGSASVYGNYGLVGDGPGVIVYAIGHNLAYIGTGKNVTNDPLEVIQPNEITELNGAKIRFNSVDHKGDFRVGDLFYVDQDAGTVNFVASALNIDLTDGATFTTGANSTFINGDRIDTGNLRISGNTVESLSDGITLNAANNRIDLLDNVNITGNLDVTGNVTIGGNITIGDDASDTIQIVAGIDSDLVPSLDSVYDLGAASKRWNNIWTNQVNVDGIEIRDNFIETTQSNADLELRANGTGEILVSSNDVQVDNNLTVNGTATLANTNITGTVTLTGAFNQTGDTTVTGDVDIAQDLTVNAAAQFEEILIDDNYITTTTSNANLELRANGSGNILIPNNNVVLNNDLTVNGSTTTVDITSTGIVTADSFTNNTILIDNNVIETTAVDTDLDLRANGTGKIVVPSNNVEISQALDVSGTTTLANTAITGTITHVGNYSQTGNSTIDGDLTVTGDLDVSGAFQFEEILIDDNYITTTSTNADLELRAAGTGSIIIPNNNVTISNNLTVSGVLTVGDIDSIGTIQANNFTTGDILIDDNFITTTVSNSDLELRAVGTGSIIIDNFSIKDSTITTTGNLTLTPGNGIMSIDSTGALILPIGNTAARPSGIAGQIRYNNELARFEGYNGTNWVNLKGVEDLDGDTNVIAESTEGANDNIIKFNVSGSTIVDIDSTRLAAPRVTVDDIQIDGNVISTITADTDLQLSANGTGRVAIDDITFKNNVIENKVNNSNTIVQNTGTGYVEFADPYGVILPVGDNATRPAAPLEGMVRYNTEDRRVELYDGTNWVSVAGATGGISFADAEDIAIEKVLIFG